MRQGIGKGAVRCSGCSGCGRLVSGERYWERILRKGGTLGLLFLAGALGLVWVFKPLIPGPLYRDPPRDLPWELPDYRGAETEWHVAQDGRIHNRVEHFFLSGITPQMLAWFYRQLPEAEVEYRGVVYPLYHIFHPTEHGRLRVLEPAADGRPGMAVGALVEREEWFGPYDSRGAARIAEFSPAGFLALPQVSGFSLGEVRHSFEGSQRGTTYRVEAIIGSDIPLLGVAINYFVRTWVFHPEMLAQWQRHQVEEVSSLQFFLPALYAQRDTGTRLRLSLIHI